MNINVYRHYVEYYLYFYSMQNAKKHTGKNISISKNELDKLVSERDEFKRQTEELKRQLEELKRMIFGSKSERYVPMDSNQLKMFEDMIVEKEKEIEKHTIVYQREKGKICNDLKFCPSLYL